MAVKMAMVLADGRLCGRIIEDGSSGETAFDGANGIVSILENACARDMAPFPSTRDRHFVERPAADRIRRTAPAPGGRATKNRRRFMKEIQESGPRGDIGSFLVCVQHRENGSFQGRVTWMEKGLTVQFRSALELAKLIDDAVRDGSEPEISWDDAENA